MKYSGSLAVAFFLFITIVSGRPQETSSNVSTTSEDPVDLTSDSTFSPENEEESGTEMAIVMTPSSSPSPTTTAVTEKVEYDGPIRRCDHSDGAKLNKCLKMILEDLKPRIKTGIPEINLPPMDPLFINNVAFTHGSGPVKVIATFSNVEVRGLAGYNKSEFGVDMKKRTLDFDLSIPTMQITGNYQLSGNLFFFPIGGSGSFWLNLGGVTARGSGKLGVVLREGHKNVIVKKTDLDLDITTIKLHLTNLFNGDKFLGTVINNFLNDNGKEIFEEVKPQIGAQVGEMVSTLTNKALSSLSPDHFADVSDSELSELL